MNEPAMVLRVRFKSGLPFDQVIEMVEQRAPEFEALTGLQQKYYLQDPESGEIAGLYIWESAEAFAVFRESELRASIAKAYQVQGEPDIEVYKVVKVLRDNNA